MSQQITLSGVGSKTLRDALRKSLIDGKPRVVGIASAFVSIEGVKQISEILKQCNVPACRLIAGTDNVITHPEALYVARKIGWQIRLGKSNAGIFHPKLVVAGQSFSRKGLIKDICSVYVGSSNLTSGGLMKNVECGLIAEAEGSLVSAAEVFVELWDDALPATDLELRNYAARFAERARRRSISELSDLGVNDSGPIPSGMIDLKGQQPPTMPALGAEFAVAAWAGLQSFTGEYRFQLEFPKNAGRVINQIIRSQVKGDGRIDIYCPDDGRTRTVQYKYYADNGMFRLNIPNDVPGVEWARKNRDGIAIVEIGLPGGAPLRIRLLIPGADASEIICRSVMLGTWGRTSTRSYGWF
jgi:HKD family nuclease